MSEIIPGIYEHYKGKRYEVTGAALESDTEEEMVVYRGLYDDPELGHNPLFVRTKKMFMENVMVDGKEVPRFRPIHNP